jgi:hypothetical protein
MFWAIQRLSFFLFKVGKRNYSRLMLTLFILKIKVMSSHLCLLNSSAIELVPSLDLEIAVRRHLRLQVNTKSNSAY